MQGFVVASDDLEGDEVLARFEQERFFRLDVEILRLVRYRDIEVDGPVQHVHKRLPLALDAVDIDGCDAARDMVAADGKQDVFHEKWLFKMDTAGGMDWQAKRLEGKVFTVRFIDSAGQIHLEETGIALLPGVDEYEILK